MNDEPAVGQIRMGSSVCPPTKPTKMLGPFPSILHIKQIGSYLNLCPVGGAGATSPSEATCAACRKLYAASGDSEGFQP
jgi:hypothetical protein